MSNLWTDNVGGNDSNDGLSSSTPKKTITAHSPVDGDTLILKGTGTAYDNQPGDAYTIPWQGFANATIKRWDGFPKPVVTQTYGQGFGRAIGVGSGGAGSVLVSGIIVQDTLEGGLGSPGSAGSVVTVDNCEFYRCGMTNDNVAIGACICIGATTTIDSLYVTNSILTDCGRSNIFCHASGTFEIYNNTISNPGASSPGVNQGDCIAIADVTPSVLWVHNNTVIHPKNSKQCVLQSGGSLSGTATIEYNTFTGAVGTGSSHKTVYCDMPAIVRSNRITTGGMAIELTGGGEIYANDVIINGDGWLGGTLPAIYGDNTTGSGTTIKNNNLTIQSGGTNFGSGIGCFESASLTGAIANNIVIGAWPVGIRRHHTLVSEDHNDIFGATQPVADESSGALATGTGTITTDPQLDVNGYPQVTSPVFHAGTSVSFKDLNGMTFNSSPSMGAREWGALDNSAKRYSSMNISSPWRGISLIPDGTIGTLDRLVLDDLYARISTVNNYLITALSGTYSYTGFSADLSAATRIDTSQERFAAMNIGNVWRGLNLFPTGTITKSGRSILANFYAVPVTVNAYTIDCASGIYVYDGEPSFSDFEIACVSGVYAYTGSDADITSVRFINAQSGVYTYTGYDVTFAQFLGATLEAISGTYSLVGYDATFERPRQIKPISGLYSLVGGSADMTWYDANGNPILPVVFQGGGFPEYIPYKKKPKKKLVQEAITTPAEIVEIIEKPKKPAKDAQKEDEDRRKKEEELLLLG
jgi:hypothetical protein